MDSAALVWPLFNSLQAFWPGLQVVFIYTCDAHKFNFSFICYLIIISLTCVTFLYFIFQLLYSLKK